MERLANNARHPLTLEDGTILAAAGTEGSVKEVDEISPADRARYIDTGIVAVLASAQSGPAGQVQQPEGATVPSTSRGREKA